MISRIWRAFALQPHRVEGFKLSKDPLFIEKVRDIVGLYLDPPDRALVLCVDEKAQIQALDRSQPLLPMRPGQAERRTPDYLRHGTINLFAALDTKAGTVIGEFHRRHRAAEIRGFLTTIDAPRRRLMAQPGRALVRATYRKATTPWRPPQHPRTAGCHPLLPRPPKPQSKPPHWDQKRRPHPRIRP